MFLALTAILVGLALFFGAYTYSMAVLIAGFLLLSIYTIATVNFRQFGFRDFLKLLTVLWFVIVAVCYIWNYAIGYWLLLLAVLCQIFIAISGLFVKK